jgi:transcriptional regulator with XRE-family HTH domain
MEPTDPIGAVIDRLCHTREELAQQLGVSPAALYSWSVGRRSPRAANRTELAKIARAHARELADLANALEGSARRPLEVVFRNESVRPDQLQERHQAWRRELKEVQARAVEARVRARETMSGANKHRGNGNGVARGARE